ncbi:hypothetical protein AX14_007281 [Amanita brunnescens Koide BX004]|nr:hypothetical protein AX14_007281 [Amanita brunnescens Koide BX004]
MAILAMCMTDSSLDIPKCVMMAIVHDPAEAQVGDIRLQEAISFIIGRSQASQEAMLNFVHDMLHSSSPAQRNYALWKECEEGQTAEAKFVKDLDRFEMASQALEYEKTKRHSSSTIL